MKIQPRERRRSEPCLPPACQRDRSPRLTSREMALDLILRRLANPGSGAADSQPHHDSLVPSLSIRLRRRDPLTPRRRFRSSTFEQIRRFEERHRAH